MRNKANDELYEVHAEYENFNELKNTIVAQFIRKKYKLYKLENENLRDNLFIYYKHIWLDTKFIIIAYPGNMDDEEFLLKYHARLIHLSGKYHCIEIFTFMLLLYIA